MRYEELLAAGTRMAAIDIDSPGQHAAMVEKLGLPFPFLSDPDRSGAISPMGLADPDDERQIAKPAIVIVDGSGEERFRWVARDFADRLPEDDVVETVQALGLKSVDAQPLAVGPADPGPKAMRLEALMPYFRGARFASVAFYRRMREIPEAKETAKAEMLAYVDEMDRYFEAVRQAKARKG